MYTVTAAPMLASLSSSRLDVGGNDGESVGVEVVGKDVGDRVGGKDVGNGVGGMVGNGVVGIVVRVGGIEDEGAGESVGSSRLSMAMITMFCSMSSSSSRLKIGSLDVHVGSIISSAKKTSVPRNDITVVGSSHVLLDEFVV
eukprot:CAMPEP_0194349376 /NCGR_PEP_ID=MMETSP0171-20130528/107054_1 /TAXON_ID=218684 /ORGANISM="Corethron pennatum, Strain L29A3" /LENGTH=141 /DNA_ID=CAMNT_0039116821 /DNA_START=514 /DNA_END=939 /DNA_ORIENTATION=-